MPSVICGVNMMRGFHRHSVLGLSLSAENSNKHHIYFHVLKVFAASHASYVVRANKRSNMLSLRSSRKVRHSAFLPDTSDTLTKCLAYKLQAQKGIFSEAGMCENLLQAGTFSDRRELLENFGFSF
jgi:hypothetical protein